MKKLSLIALAMLVGLISSPAWAKPLPPRTYVSPTGSDKCPTLAPLAVRHWESVPDLQLRPQPDQSGRRGNRGCLGCLCAGDYHPLGYDRSGTGSVRRNYGPGIGRRRDRKRHIRCDRDIARSHHLRRSGETGSTSTAALNCRRKLRHQRSGGTLRGSTTPAAHLFVKDTVIENFYFSASVVIASSTYGNSLSHVWLEGSDVGLGVVEGATTISNSVIGDSYQGILAVGGEVNVESCQIANDDEGIEVDSGIARVSNSTVTDNFATGLYNDGGTLYSRQNNTVAGNGNDPLGVTTSLATI